MSKKLRIFLGVFALLAVLIAVIVFRTFSLSKPVQVNASPAKLISVDGDALAANLSRAVQFKTVTMQNHEDTDWPVFTEFQSWLLETYPNFYGAVKSEQIEQYAQFHIWQGSDPSLAPIVFLAHQDVVPASETDVGWDYPPFSGQIADGFIYGRGTIDDKGSLIGMLEAADRLAASGYKPSRTLMFGFGHDEEVAGSGAKAIAELMKARGIAPYAVIDEGGAVATGMLDVEGPAALIGVAEKGYLTLILTAKARGGHSSTPPTYTAIGALAKAIAAIEANPFESGLDKVGEAMLRATAPEQKFTTRMAIANLWLFRPTVEEQFRGTPTGRALLGTTIAPTMIEGGLKKMLYQETQASM